MSIALHKPMTLAEFLGWEERQELRYEFDGFQPVAMIGGTPRHEVVGVTLRALLHERLRGNPCRPWGLTAKIEVQGHIRYPDACVSCTLGAPNATIVPNPIVVFDILSPSTLRTDRIDKLRDYQATPSIQRYVILEQDSIGAMVSSRLGNEWTVTTLTDADTLFTPEIGIELPLATVYADAELDDPVAAEM